MNRKEIQKARLALKHAGTIADRNHLHATLLARLGNNVEALRQQKLAVAKEYRRQLERWRTEEVPESAPVCAIPNDVHDSRLYRMTAMFALLSEMALASWVFQRLGIVWWLGALTALFITFTLHGVFLQIFDNPERPKETLHRIRRTAALPAVVGFLIALALGMLARYVYGSLAVALLPFFSVSLWLGTISLLVLSASLFTVAHLRGWSLRYAAQHGSLEDEERENAEFLEELRREAAEKPAASMLSFQPQLPIPNVRSNDGKGMTISVFLPFALLLGWSYGCSAGADSRADAAPPSAAVRQNLTQASPAALHILIDWSGSCVRQAMEDCWGMLQEDLPEIIESRNIDRLSLWAFDQDGWCPRRLRAISLPVRQLPAHASATASEWESFGNIRDALRASEDQAWRAQARMEEERYRRTVAVALHPLQSLATLPPPGYAAEDTDIAGLFKRISESRDKQARIFIIISDLADTRQREMPHMKPPEGDVRAVVLLVPAQAGDARRATGACLSGPEQFDLRLRQLRQSAPWALLVPYFSRDLAEVLGGSD